ncbi:hypothetical protein Leryth_002917, partial [Lithospermum erythrorhizon]
KICVAKISWISGIVFARVSMLGKSSIQNISLKTYDGLLGPWDSLRTSLVWQMGIQI